jgi:hypothetical protein
MARHPRPAGRPASLLTLLLAALALLAPTGCWTTRPQGQTGVEVRYDGFHTSEVRLPERVDPETALALVRQVLVARGYIIREDVRSGAGGVVRAAIHRQPSELQRRVGPALGLTQESSVGLEGILARTGAQRLTVRVEEAFPGARLRVQVYPDPVDAEAEGRAIMQQVLLAAGL